MICEKCWAEALRDSIYDPSVDQADRYRRIISARNASGKVCSPQEQAGPYWDEVKQEDIRLKLWRALSETAGSGAEWSAERDYKGDKGMMSFWCRWCLRWSRLRSSNETRPECEHCGRA